MEEQLILFLKNINKKNGIKMFPSGMKCWNIKHTSIPSQLVQQKPTKSLPLHKEEIFLNSFKFGRICWSLMDVLKIRCSKVDPRGSPDFTT
jgi:hypothetical protein